MGNRKNQIRNTTAKATQKSKSTGNPPTYSSNCSGTTDVVDGKVCVLGSLDGTIGEDISIRLLKWQYGDNAELMLMEDDPDLSSCDKLVINAHSEGPRLLVFPGHIKDGFTANSFANYLEENGFQGSEITLAACQLGTSIDTDNDGRSDYTFGQDLADITGKPVKAYPHDIRILFGKEDEAIREEHREYNRDGSSEFKKTSKGRPITFRRKDPLREIEEKLGIR